MDFFCFILLHLASSNFFFLFFLSGVSQEKVFTWASMHTWSDIINPWIQSARQDRIRLWQGDRCDTCPWLDSRNRVYLFLHTVPLTLPCFCTHNRGFLHKRIHACKSVVFWWRAQGSGAFILHLSTEPSSHIFLLLILVLPSVMFPSFNVILFFFGFPSPSPTNLILLRFYLSSLFSSKIICFSVPQPPLLFCVFVSYKFNIDNIWILLKSDMQVISYRKFSDGHNSKRCKNPCVTKFQWFDSGGDPDTNANWTQCSHWDSNWDDMDPEPRLMNMENIWRVNTGCIAEVKELETYYLVWRPFSSHPKGFFSPELKNERWNVFHTDGSERVLTCVLYCWRVGGTSYMSCWAGGGCLGGTSYSSCSDLTVSYTYTCPTRVGTTTCTQEGQDETEVRVSKKQRKVFWLRMLITSTQLTE